MFKKGILTSAVMLSLVASCTGAATVSGTATGTLGGSADFNINNAKEVVKDFRQAYDDARNDVHTYITSLQNPLTDPNQTYIALVMDCPTWDGSEWHATETVGATYGTMYNEDTAVTAPNAQLFRDAVANVIAHVTATDEGALLLETNYIPPVTTLKRAMANSGSARYSEEAAAALDAADVEALKFKADGTLLGGVTESNPLHPLSILVP